MDKDNNKYKPQMPQMPQCGMSPMMPGMGMPEQMLYGYPLVLYAYPVMYPRMPMAGEGMCYGDPMMYGGMNYPMYGGMPGCGCMPGMGMRDFYDTPHGMPLGINNSGEQVE